MIANCFACGLNDLNGLGPCDQHTEKPASQVHPLFERILEDHLIHDTRQGEHQ